MSKQREAYQLTDFYSLAQIDKLLSSKHKQVSREFAQQLFELVIPSILDVEVDRLYKQSTKLLEESAKLAGLTEQAVKKQIANVTGEEELPESCAVCANAQLELELGDSKLICLYENTRHGEALAALSYEAAFNKPPSTNWKCLTDMVKDKPIPDWCPKRNK